MVKCLLCKHDALRSTPELCKELGEVENNGSHWGFLVGQMILFSEFQASEISLSVSNQSIHQSINQPANQGIWLLRNHI